MDTLETLQRQVQNAINTLRRAQEEGTDPGLCDAVRDYLQEAIAKISAFRKNALDTIFTPTTYAFYPRQEQTMAQQVAEIQRRANLEGCEPAQAAPSEAPVHPFIPPHLYEIYLAHHGHDTAED